MTSFKVQKADPNETEIDLSLKDFDFQESGHVSIELMMLY